MCHSCNSLGAKGAGSLCPARAAAGRGNSLQPFEVLTLPNVPSSHELGPAFCSGAELGPQVDLASLARWLQEQRECWPVLPGGSGPAEAAARSCWHLSSPSGESDPALALQSLGIYWNPDPSDPQHKRFSSFRARPGQQRPGLAWQHRSGRTARAQRLR